jgi:hypothetical protein
LSFISAPFHCRTRQSATRAVDFSAHQVPVKSSPILICPSLHHDE